MAKHIQSKNLAIQPSGNHDHDEGQCDGNEDDGAASALDIVLVRSEAKAEGDAQHMLADQDRWRAKLGHKSTQVRKP